MKELRKERIGSRAVKMVTAELMGRDRWTLWK